MMPTDFDLVIEQYRQSLANFVNGDAKPLLKLLSKGNDVSLAGGFGGFVQSNEQVAKAFEFAAPQFKEGHISFESLTKVVTHDMGYIVEVERYESKLGGSEGVSLDILRVTSIFRKEGADWKLVHRHGDPTQL
jgi:ketosteroid isomerase-like protein